MEQQPTPYTLASFIQANMKDCGHIVSREKALLIANIVVDYLAINGSDFEEE